jgi:hypothetical protein
MKRLPRLFVFAATVAGPMGAASVAFAQAGPPPGTQVTAPGTGTVTTQPPLPSPQPGSGYVPVGYGGGYGNPQSPNGTIGGGNATESSAHPVTGDQEDTFDLTAGRGQRGTARGADDGPVFTTRPRPGGVGGVGGEVPGSHLVVRGDTLWGICDTYLQNPYQWPRIWSYNPQIKNPNWIYPGDEVRLRSDAGALASGATPPPSAAPGFSLVDRRRRVPHGTVFLRDQGWIRDESDDVWGEITGAATDKIFLSDLDEVYLSLKKGHDVQLGQELTLFKTRQTVAVGAIVQVLGTVRIDDWNPKERVARGRMIETLDVVERGAKVGPVARSFAVVAPVRNGADVQAHVLASLHPNEFFGQNQVVFIDKGEAAGLKPGNRMFVTRRGDAWRKTLVAADVGYRVSADDERPMPEMEQTPGSSRDDQRYPDELVAELRVVDVKKDSAACLVTQSRVEIELHDLVVARKGY